MLLNPDIPLRTAYITALSGIGVPVFPKKVPNDIAAPSQYCLISSQTKEPQNNDENCLEWMCSIKVDCIFVGAAGFAAPINNDLVEQSVLNAILSGISVAGFRVNSYDFIQTTNLDSDSPTQSIERRVILFRHWLSQIT